MAEHTSTQTRAATGPYQWRWIAFTVVVLASVMDLLDALVTNVAGPSIRNDIGGGPALIQWLGAGYTLALATGLIIGGRLGDIVGRKPAFLAGAAGFTVSSVLCAASVSPGMLIACRVAQGLFGAVMLPQGLGVIRTVFPADEQSKAFGAFGPAMGLASVIGPVLGGALITWNLFGTGWRMIFLINVPLGLCAVAGAILFIPSHQERNPVRLDVVGAILAAAAALMLVYPVVQGRALGWPAWTFALMAGSVVLFVIFARVEVYIDRRGIDPLVVPGLFRNRAFSGGLAVGLVTFTLMVGFGLVLTLYLQIGLGYSPLKAGASVLPQAIGSVFGFIASGSGLAQKLGRRSLHLGMVLMALGQTGVILTIIQAGGGMSPWELVPSLLVYGAGLGLFLAPYFDIVLAGVAHHEVGSASGTLTAVQQFGSALGVAILGTVFFTAVGTQVGNSVSSHAPAFHAELAAAGVSGPAADVILSDLRACTSASSTATGAETRLPASCERLSGEVAVAAKSGSNPSAVAAAVHQQSVTVREQGFAGSIRLTSLIILVALILPFCLVFLLPRFPRRYDEGYSGPSS
jgi:EmrB/QacA subfamily drug resistance transporter